MSKFCRMPGKVCWRCGKKGQLYYKASNRSTCVECTKELAREYSKSSRGRNIDRIRRRGERGREYYKGLLEREGRREQLNKSQRMWVERNEEENRMRCRVLARIHKERKRKRRSRGGSEVKRCQDCKVRGKKLYVYVDWDTYAGEWIPEYKMVCSLCLGKRRQKPDEEDKKISEVVLEYEIE